MLARIGVKKSAVKNVYARDLDEAGRQESVNKDHQQGTQ
jgi:hypothetical protein